MNGAHGVSKGTLEATHCVYLGVTDDFFVGVEAGLLAPVQALVARLGQLYVCPVAAGDEDLSWDQRHET